MGEDIKNKKYKTMLIKAINFGKLIAVSLAKLSGYETPFYKKSGACKDQIIWFLYFIGVNS